MEEGRRAISYLKYSSPTPNRGELFFRACVSFRSNIVRILMRAFVIANIERRMGFNRDEGRVRGRYTWLFFFCSRAFTIVHNSYFHWITEDEILNPKAGKFWYVIRVIVSTIENWLKLYFYRPDGSRGCRGADKRYFSCNIHVSIFTRNVISNSNDEKF